MLLPNKSSCQASNKVVEVVVVVVAADRVTWKVCVCECERKTLRERERERDVAKARETSVRNFVNIFELPAAIYLFLRSVYN